MASACPMQLRWPVENGAVKRPSDVRSLPSPSSLRVRKRPVRIYPVLRWYHSVHSASPALGAPLIGRGDVRQPLQGNDSNGAPPMHML
eukprot:scaffold112649_cov72-Phaeocystis_antarctica.AAC.2